MWGFPDASNATGGSDTSRSLVALEVPCPNGSSASVVTVALVAFTDRRWIEMCCELGFNVSCMFAT
jgi:hypothetical protein